MREAELPNAALTTSRRFYDAEPFATEMVIKSVIEGIHFYKTEKIKAPMIMKKYMKLENTEELQEAYSFYVKLLAEKPYPYREGHSNDSRLVEASGCAEGESGAVHSDEGDRETR